MKLFVGLGNPGSKYVAHRHNVGFMLLDQLAEEYGPVSWSKKFSGELATIEIDNQKILILKPHTYMNLSGQSVQAAMAFYKLKPEQITVFHDDLDLPVAKCRIKTGGGHGGHNGLRDIDSHIGKNYRRVRIGIDHPGEKHAVSGYVLHDFAKSERAEIDALIERLSSHISLLIRGQEVELLNQVAK